MSNDELTRHQGQGKLHEGADHSAPYPVSRLAPAIDLVDLAKDIARADDMVTARTSSQLRVIADQVKALQQEAKKILASAQRDQQLHHARCNFQRKPGHVYHLYRRSNGQTEFSMLSPDDWNGSPPQEYLGSYRLEADMSWTPLEELDKADDSRELVQRLLESS